MVNDPTMESDEGELSMKRLQYTSHPTERTLCVKSNVHELYLNLPHSRRISALPLSMPRECPDAADHGNYLYHYCLSPNPLSFRDNSHRI